jgi:tetratricopeptide (TPR) repeat protein
MAHVNLGFVRSLLGDKDAAMAHYAEALRLEPEHALASNNVGYLLIQQNRLEDALDHLLRALRREPRNLLALKNTGLAYFGLGRFDEALAHYERARAVADADPSIHASLTAIHLKREDYGLAARHLERQVELSPDDIRPKVSLAWLLATCPEDAVRDGARALKLAETACKVSGRRHAEPLRVLAAALAEEGRFEEAAETARAALRLVGADREDLARRLRENLERYEDGKPVRSGGG